LNADLTTKGMGRYRVVLSLSPKETTVDVSLDGWDIGRFDAVDWSPWGSSGNARAKILATGDGYYVALVEAEPGYHGDPHTHTYTEFNFVLEGSLRNQGVPMEKGGAYVAAPGSTHDDFVTETGATYLSIFKL
jgi:anti-sigma factor ChrR (cupin superfamily)